MDKDYKEEFLALAANEGFSLKERKDIPYGVILKLSDDNGEYTIRIYENSKGQLSIDASSIKSEMLSTIAGRFLREQSDILLSPPLIGSDEAGKGDWLGPLTVCALYADEKMYDDLASIGIKDSKKLSDKRIEALKDEIIRICPDYCVISVDCRAFNELYAKNGNINAILSEAHGAAIRNVYKKTGCNRILIDKFAPDYRMDTLLKEYRLNVIQQNRAEVNCAVAAASILARYTYMAKLRQMSELYKISFPPGASEAANEAARQFIALFGRENLGNICKISYKNTQKV